MEIDDLYLLGGLCVVYIWHAFVIESGSCSPVPDVTSLVFSEMEMLVATCSTRSPQSSAAYGAHLCAENHLCLSLPGIPTGGFHEGSFVVEVDSGMECVWFSCVEDQLFL